MNKTALWQAGLPQVWLTRNSHETFAMTGWGLAAFATLHLFGIKLRLPI